MARLPPQPFVPLALAACAGVVVLDYFIQPSWQLAAAALALGLTALLHRAFLLPFVFLVFGALHTMQHHENPGHELSGQLTEPRRVSVQGLVLAEPNQQTAQGCSFPLRAETLDGAPEPAALTFVVRWRGAAPEPGDRVAIEGTLRNVPPPRNPGEFDQPAWLARKGIWSEVRTDRPAECTVLARNCGNPITHAAYVARKWLQRALSKGVEDDPEIAALIQSMVLGLDGNSSQEMKSLFRETGTLHLFAVSGLNVAMLAGIVWAALKPFGVGQRIAAAISIPILVFYAYVTGLTPSGVRATWMLAILLAGQILERPPLPLNTVAAAAFLILLQNTEELFTPGFQLSFGVVLALMFFSTPLRTRIGTPGAPDELLPRRLWNPMHRVRWMVSSTMASFLAVALAAWIGSTPLGIWHFRMISPVAVMANLIAVPLAFVILICGVLACAGAVVSSWLAAVFNNASWLAAKFLVWCMAGFSSVPYGHFFVGIPEVHPPTAEITLFDFGEGGAMAIRSHGRNWLFDCGRAMDAQWTVIPFLSREGVNRLDGMCLTHGDAGHIGGAIPILQHLTPKGTFLPPMQDRSLTRKRLLEWAAANRREILPVTSGSVLHLSPEVEAEVLFPPIGWQARQADDQALVARIKTSSGSILMMSDSGFITERWLMEHVADLRADVLATGLHRNDISSTPEFLDRVQPQLLVAPENPAHTSESAVTALREACSTRGIQLMRQGETGAVTLRFDTGQITATPFLPGTAQLRFSSRAR